MNYLIQKKNLPISKLFTNFDTSLIKLSANTLEDIQNLKEKIISIQVKYNLDEKEALKTGLKIKIKHSGLFQCTSCKKNIKKLFEGFCFPCFKKKASADRCIMSPNLCHYNLGTCREPLWGEEYCYQPHYVYLSYTDKFKVGITRQTQIPTRWIDQGASSAALLAKVTSRHQAGIIEHNLKEILHDKSHWLNMLKNGNKRPSLEEFQDKISFIFNWIKQNEIFQNKEIIVDTPAHLKLSDQIEYFHSPVIVNLNYDIPSEVLKFKSINLDKSSEIEGIITGIKGQYIFLGENVFNMRRHEGYIVDLDLEEI
ncbi:DUF2797 domain-containing protein [Silvanigrella paludirubra]|uniref:DUF2797 domain-containing protein n=1 Tax=Silvanigrella paludirubra TaxID=2499159 RepID=UPI0013871B94|nr:DUF2797 domain-containing protein [Silvanigrella paludirubra]